MVLARSGPVAKLEAQWLDASFQLLRTFHPKPAQAQVVIVGVDQASIGASGKPFALMLDEFALALDGFRLGDARAVGIDLVFPAVPYEHLVPGASRRLALALARLRAAGPLVLGRLDRADQDTGDAGSLYAAMAGIGGEGLLLVPADRDGVLRRIVDSDGGGSASLLLAPRLAEKLGRRSANGIVDFSIGEPFGYFPMQQIVALAKTGAAASLRQLFAGKVVLLGAVLPDQDRQRLPVALANWDAAQVTSGVVFQAQALRSLLQQSMIEARPWIGDCAALLALVLLWPLRYRPGRAIAAALALAVLVLGGSVFLLSSGMQAPVAAPLLTLVCGMLLMSARAYTRQLTEQRRVRSIFAGYVSPAILDTVLSGALKDGTAGKRQPLAFLFADIRGFTAFCAINPPEQVIAFLNRYYGAVTVALHRYGGTIDKFSGDGIMVFFGAPQPSVNPARDAVLAALAMLEALDAFNAELASEGAWPVEVGIGIAYGDAVLGNVGSAERHDYTATGAATTLAAHIQQYSKQVPHALLVEQDAFERAQLSAARRARFRRLDVELEKHGRVALAAYAGPGAGHV